MQASFTSPLPPTLNEQIDYARGNRYKSAEIKKRWTNAIATECGVAKLPFFPGLVWLSFEWQVKTHARDPDNIAASSKYLLDGMVAAGVIAKDNLTIIQSPIIHHYVKGSDRVIVTISDTYICGGGGKSSG
ncbi:hypothetical protein [Chroococcidiopsis sp.]|uniref:hypothetical protein n=1 Tax=Chroococcidiopsis sp. TaxID=3088168 RepID=UPI003F3D3BAD